MTGPSAAGSENGIPSSRISRPASSCARISFAEKCAKVGVDGLIIPDLPLEEQQPLKDALAKQNATILIQLVAPVSGKRIPEILKDAKGFVYCVSSMGVTGQGASFHNEARYCNTS